MIRKTKQEKINNQMNDYEIIKKVAALIGEVQPWDVSQLRWAVRQLISNNKQYKYCNQKQILANLVYFNERQIEHDHFDTMQKCIKQLQPKLKSTQFQSTLTIKLSIYQYLKEINYIQSFNLQKDFNKQTIRLINNNQDRINIFYQLMIQITLNKLLQIKIQYGYPQNATPSMEFLSFVYQIYQTYFKSQTQQKQQLIQKQNQYQKLKYQKYQQKQNQYQYQKRKYQKYQQEQNQCQKRKYQKYQQKQNQYKKRKYRSSQNLYQKQEQYIPNINQPNNQQQIPQKPPKQYTLLGKMIWSGSEQAQKQRKLVSKQTGCQIKRKPIELDKIKIIHELDQRQIKQILISMTTNQKKQFIQVLRNVQNNISKIPLFSLQIQLIKQQIDEIIKKTQRCIHSNVLTEHQSYKQIKWIVLLYKQLQQNYQKNTLRRKFIMKFCQQEKVQYKLFNPFGVFKALQCKYQNQYCKQNKILQSLRNLSIKQMDKKIDNQIRHQFNDIHLSLTSKKLDKQPEITFQKLTSNKQKLITFLFSGFLSQDCCKMQQWVGTIQNIYDSQMYAVKWESKKDLDMWNYLLSSATDIGAQKIGAGLLGKLAGMFIPGGAAIKLLAFVPSIFKIVAQNPFNIAKANAISTGQYIAEFLIRNCKHHFINLMGFSLGTVVILNVLKRLASKNYLHIIHKVYLLGGAADKQELEQFLKKISTPLSIINVYCNNDTALSILQTFWRMEAIGRHQLTQKINQHSITNYDLTQCLDGHCTYRENLKFISQILQIDDD